jgi:uncharacterized SAM-binding protein YcdF (DUF218 family)
VQELGKERDDGSVAAGRGVALFVGGFSLLNAAGDLLSPGFDANRWWIDLRPLPHGLSLALLAVGGALLLAHGLRAARQGWRRAATFVAALFLLAVTASNAVTAVVMRLAGRIGGASWVPFSLGVTLALAAVLVSLSAEAPRGGGARWRVALVAALLAVLAPLGQMLSFGRTDYRRPADVIVVFGARVYADGRPSPALRDRVDTAARLYREGLAPRVLVSGGAGDGAVHETVAMRNLLVAQGVPARAVVRDEGGVDSRSTVRASVALCRAEGWCRVLAVSHGYHLARVKMTYERAGLHTVYTVPSGNSLGLSRVRFMAREVAALWFYYATALPRREGR